MKLRHASFGTILFTLCNYAILAALAAACVFPVIHVLAISLSAATPVAAGEVNLWPVEFTTRAYAFVLAKPEFVSAFLRSVLRVAIGVPLGICVTLLVAYPLSRERKEFRARNAAVWFFVIPMLFGGGLIPTYIIVNATGLIDTIWALVLPGAVGSFSAILLLNFIRGLPRQLEEAAYMDGAGHWRTLFSVVLPLSLPVLATLTLFSFVGHWNSWFDGIIYMNSPAKYPLQSYLKTVVLNKDPRFLTEHDVKLLRLVSDRTTRAAEIFVAMVPVMAVYPFLQRYFIHGIKLGSVKE